MVELDEMRGIHRYGPKSPRPSKRESSCDDV
jgi:hypothetical protein